MRFPFISSCCTVLIVVMTTLVASPVSAAPFRPSSDAQTLEVLPLKSSDPVTREMAQLRASLRQDPNNAVIAVRLARRYYEQVAEEGDPRYLGYAQAALAPWWTMPSPPIDVQVMRASMRQFLHDFEGAIADLDKVLAKEPRHAQAHALRATIHIVQARYDQGRQDCEALHGITDELIAVGCSAMIDGLTGHAQAGYDKLNAALETATKAKPEERLWILIRLAELSQRLDNASDAERHFKNALSLQITDTFLLAAYADFLLDHNRPAEVVKLLANSTRSDTLLLRLVFAEQATRAPTASERRSALAARFDAAQMRGDTVHQQEEARFALHVENDPKKALRLALENWKVQKEPRDARIVLEAALASNDRAAAQPAMAWLEMNRVEDHYMAELAQKIKGAVK